MELNTIHQMDCVEGMRLLPPDSVDLVLTDPPYNITQNPWDQFDDVDFLLFTEQWMREAYRVSKGGFMLMFWSQQKMHLLDKINTRWKRKRMIIWNMPNAPIHNQDGMIYTWQPCILYEKENERKPTINNGAGYTSSDVIVCNFPADERLGHPTIKPSKLITKLLVKYSTEGDTILDPFMGSGTTAVVAKRAGRNFIGFERDPEYCKIIHRRLEATSRQRTLVEMEVIYDGRGAGNAEDGRSEADEHEGSGGLDGPESELGGLYLEQWREEGAPPAGPERSVCGSGPSPD
jgi:DNA modification methylase